MVENEQETLYKLSLFEQQLQQLQEQLTAVENGLNELNSLTKGLNELKNSKGKEIYAPIGRGIFIKSKVLSENLLVDVGNKNFVKKDIPKTQELIKNQIKKLEEVKIEIDGNIKIIQADFKKTMDDIQKKDNKK